MLLGSTHYLSARWSYARQQEPLAAAAVTRIDELGTAITVLGGHNRILPCGSSVVTINHSLQTALAWKLGTTLARVKTVVTGGQPVLAFVGPRDSIDGGEPPILYHFQKRVLATVGAWSAPPGLAPSVRRARPASAPEPRLIAPARHAGAIAFALKRWRGLRAGVGLRNVFWQ